MESPVNRSPVSGSYLRSSSLSPTQSYPYSATPSSLTSTSPTPDSPSPAFSTKSKSEPSSPMPRTRPKQNTKKARRGLVYLKMNLKDSVSSGLINPINKVQLSILNTGLIKINDDVSRASGIIPAKPFDLNRGKFEKHIELLDKYKVLLKMEYYVSRVTRDACHCQCCNRFNCSACVFLREDGIEKRESLDEAGI